MLQSFPTCIFMHLMPSTGFHYELTNSRFQQLLLSDPCWQFVHVYLNYFVILKNDPQPTSNFIETPCFYPIVSWTILSHPISCYSIPSILSISMFHPVLSYPNLFPSHPVLTYLIPFHVILFYPISYFSILSYLVSTNHYFLLVEHKHGRDWMSEFPVK